MDGGERRRRRLQVARVAYLALAAAAVAYLAADRRDDVGELLERTNPAWLALGLVLAFVQLSLNTAFWHAALGAVGRDDPVVRYRDVLGASARSLLARYVPGSVWYALGRAALLSRHGVRRRTLVTVAVLEATLSISTGAALGIGLLALTADPPGGATTAGVAAVIAAAVSTPPVLNRVLAVWARRRGGVAPQLGWAQLGRLVAWMVLFWAGGAATFTVYLHAFGGIELPGVAEVAGSFMVAWVVGFVAVFAPQGVGVFEAAVAGLLIDGPVGAAALVVAGFRVLTLTRDVIAVVAAEVGNTRRGRLAPSSDQA